MAIKNIIFDVGNVLVRWDPHHIVTQAFPERADKDKLVLQLFKHQNWFDINLGKIDQETIIAEYHKRLGLDKNRLINMMAIAKDSLTPIEGSFDLLKSLHGHYKLYALTDNTKDFMAYLRAQYDFWALFEGVVVSAEVGHLKPSREIYMHLLNSYALTANETVFIDDYLINIEGAKAVGLEGIHFENARQCREALLNLQVRIT